jgi:hypothetical protein
MQNSTFAALIRRSCSKENWQAQLLQILVDAIKVEPVLNTSLVGARVLDSSSGLQLKSIG